MSGSANEVKVLIVDDSAEIAALYHRLIDGSPGLICVGTLDRADAILSTVKSLGPDVVLLDLRMPGKDSLESITELSQQFPQVRAIAFSGFDDPKVADSVLDAGGWGLISKSQEPEKVIDAIRAVAQGQTVCPTKSPSRTKQASKTNSAIAVLCVDDNAEVLAALRQTLSLHGLKWCGSRPDATDLHAAVEFHRPAVVVLDLDMPGRNPIKMIAELARRFPDVRVVVYSAHVGRELVENAMEAGVWGYVSKADGEETLVRTIRRVYGGEFVLAPEVRRLSTAVESNATQLPAS